MERSGSYPIETRREEVERLGMQADAMALDAEILLDRIGVGVGWRCLELACGAGGIIDLLSKRVGTDGQVVGLDADAALLDAARAKAERLGLANVTWTRDDAYRSRLPGGSFDLVHMRFILGTAGQFDDLMAEAIRLTRPGGIVAAQECDIETLRCYPRHAAWDQLVAALDTLLGQGGDLRLAQTLYRRFRGLGLEKVGYRPFLVGYGSSDRMADYLPRTILSMREPLVARGIITDQEIDEAVRAVRGHLADPDTVSTSYLVAQVWGSRPA